MLKNVLLTYEQLFFLGEMMNAEYIDYRYIESMKDIEQRYSFLKNTATSDLVEKDLVEEDFFGEITVKPEVVELLEPIFFGKTESAVEVVTIGEETVDTTNLLHFYEQKITLVSIKSDKIEVSSITDEQLTDLVVELFSDAQCDVTDIVYDSDKVSKVIRINTATVAVGSNSEVFAVCDNAMFFEEKDSSVVCISKNDFISKVEALLKGEL